MPSFACLFSGAGLCEIAARRAEWAPLWGLSGKQDEFAVNHFYQAVGHEYYGYRPYVIDLKSSSNYDRLPVPDWLHINYSGGGIGIIESVCKKLLPKHISYHYQDFCDGAGVRNFLEGRGYKTELMCGGVSLLRASKEELKPLELEEPDTKGLYCDERVREYMTAVGVPGWYPLPSDPTPLLHSIYCSTPPYLIKAIAQSFNGN